MHDKRNGAELVLFIESYVVGYIDVFADGGPEPAQYRTKPEWLSGEQALLYQILKHGVEEALGKVSPGSIGFTENKGQIIRDAHAWLFDTQRDDLTSFAGLCRELNINPARIRKAMLLKLAGQTRQPQEEPEE